ncbi:MAG TPA: hypothetical protein V6C81_01900 [Planktothrix sp.]|jgi:hypothetical protein
MRTLKINSEYFRSYWDRLTEHDYWRRLVALTALKSANPVVAVTTIPAIRDGSHSGVDDPPTQTRSRQGPCAFDGKTHTDIDAKSSNPKGIILDNIRMKTSGSRSTSVPA